MEMASYAMLALLLFLVPAGLLTLVALILKFIEICRKIDEGGYGPDKEYSDGLDDLCSV
jgi:hypothetical protein